MVDFACKLSTMASPFRPPSFFCCTVALPKTLFRLGDTKKSNKNYYCVLLRIYFLKMSPEKRRKWHFRDPKFQTFLGERAPRSPRGGRLRHSKYYLRAYSLKIAATPLIFSENALSYLYLGCLPFAERSLTNISRSDFDIPYYMKFSRHVYFAILRCAYFATL